MISPPPYPRTPNPQFPNTPSTFHLSRFTFFVFQSGISNLKSAIFYTYSPIHRLTKFLSSLVTQPVLRSSLLRRVDRVHCDFSIATCLLPDAFRLSPFPCHVSRIRFRNPKPGNAFDNSGTLWCIGIVMFASAADGCIICLES